MLSFHLGGKVSQSIIDLLLLHLQILVSRPGKAWGCSTNTVVIIRLSKALERGNSIPRPNKFCDTDKVNVFAVSSQNIKFYDSRVIDTLLFYENILLLVFLARY